MGCLIIQVYGRPIEEIHDIYRYDIALLDRVQEICFVTSH